MGADPGAAAALDLRPPGILADHGDGAHTAAIQRQNRPAAQHPVVLEQDRRLPAHFPDQRAIFRAVDGLFSQVRGLHGPVFKGPNPLQQPQDAPHLVVEHGLGQCAGLHRCQHGVAHPSGRAGHLNVQPSGRHVLFVGAIPIRDNGPVKAPLFLQNFGQKPVAGTGIVRRSPGCTRSSATRAGRPAQPSGRGAGRSPAGAAPALRNSC